MALKIWLPLNGSLENKGISNVTVTNNGATVDNNGKIGKCYNLTNGPITVSQLPNPKNISVAFWFKRTADTGTRQFMFTAWNGVTCELSTNGAPTFAVYRDGYPTISSSPITVSSGWIHYCGTFSEKEGLKLYINGSLVAQNNVITPIAWSTTSGQIGKFATYASMSALMNDFRIYDHALSAKEVKEISQGLVLHYKLDGWCGGVGENLIDTNDAIFLVNGRLVKNYSNNGGSVSCSDSSGDTYCYLRLIETLKAGVQYTISCDVSGIVSGSNITYAPNNGQGLSLRQDVSLHNGRCFATFTPSVDISTKFLFDDINRTWGSGQGTYTMSRFKIEKGPIATNFCLSNNDSGINKNIVKDSSGYENNGNIVGLLTAVPDSSRYDISTFFTGRPCAISVNSSFSHLNTFTYNCWFKRSSNEPAYLIMGYQYGNNSSGSLGIEINGCAGFHYYAHANGNGETQIGSSYNCNDNQWHMLTATYDGTKIITYLDGQKTGEKIVTLLTSSRTFVINYPSGSENSGVYRDYQGYLSDIRVYVTALSAEDIKALYQIPTSIDNLGNLHTFEVEENEDRNISVLKNGIVSAPLPMEYMYLNDGSVWMPVMYHNNKAHTNLFSSSDDFTKFVQHNIDCWADFSLISAVTRPDTSKYEFLVVQQDLHADTFKSFRWSQTNNPITTTSISGFTAITTGVTNTAVGGLCKCSGATYLAISNSTGNWWQACGCWTAYNDGIPGFGNIATDGVIALYIRVSKEIYTQFKSWLLLGNQLIEE